jgi:thiosulfate/3-mercaptopyruvate sulfurtransferase
MNRLAAALIASSLLTACGADADEADWADASATPVATEEQSSFFVSDATSATGQILLVGQERRNDIPGATFIPFSTFSVERDGIPNEFPTADSMAAMLEAAGVAGERFLIVGEPIPAGRAWAAFDYLGLGNRAALLDGGPRALADGRADTAPAATGTAGALPVAVREDMIVDSRWVHARLDDPAIAILDARPPAEFSGDIPGEGIDRPGHIPGARNVFWQTLLHPADNRLKDEATLRRIFEEAGADPGDTIVAYCRTGGQASFLYTVARHLGYDVRLYDGSFIEWSRTDFPVER